jgi:hypothetical protein
VPDVKAFFVDIDRAWQPLGTEPVLLHLIGSTALMLLTGYERGTKDSDVLETAELSVSMREQLTRLAGPASDLRRRHRMYIEIVPGGLPFLPQVPTWHDVELPEAALNLRLRALDVVDVVVAKLIRFNSTDVEDIEAMVKLGRIPRDQLIARFRAAVDILAYEARASELPRCIDNLHRVEEDMLQLPPTEIELPSWI